MRPSGLPRLCPESEYRFAVIRSLLNRLSRLSKETSEFGRTPPATSAVEWTPWAKCPADRPRDNCRGCDIEMRPLHPKRFPAASHARHHADRRPMSARDATPLALSSEDST